MIVGPLRLCEIIPPRNRFIGTKTTFANTMRSITPLFILLALAVGASAQPTSEDIERLQVYEREMMVMGDSMINDTIAEVRIRNAYFMIRMVKQSLQINGSFFYPFDSLRYLSITYPPDSTFRIISWHLELSSGKHRHFGAVQMRSKDNLVLTPLIDASDFIPNHMDTITDYNGWYGALYYRIIQRDVGKQRYYFLLGFDANDRFSNKKVIDVLHFGKDGSVRLGAPLIEVPVGDEVRTVDRFIIEYAKPAVASLNYADSLGFIVFDHLVPVNEKSKGVYSTYVPDGTYEGLVWKNNMWKHDPYLWKGEGINEMDNPPRPNPVDFDRERRERQKAEDRVRDRE